MDLTNDELRVVLARWDGIEPISFGWLAFNPETQGIAYQGDFKADVENWLDAGFRRRKVYVIKEDVRFPDYPNDLNAIATLEAKLTDEEHGDYLARLHCIVHALDGKWYDTVRGSVLTFEQMRKLHSASAQQRCRALVAVLGLTK